MELTNPYLAARREWDERYGDLITRARNWRTLAIICAVTTLVATGRLMWLSAHSRIVPFVVLVDNLRRPLASGIAEQATVNDDRLKRASLLAWVGDFRLVTSDGMAQRKAIDHVYAQIASGSQAQAFVSDFYRAIPPFKRAQIETVSIDVNSVLPTSDRTFEVDWVETTRDLYGAVKGIDRWKGSFSIALNPPTDERLARINPLGVYVTNVSLAKVL